MTKEWGQATARNIEGDPKRAHAYTGIAFVGSNVLLTYYDTANWSDGLSLRFRSIPFKWCYGS